MQSQGPRAFFDMMFGLLAGIGAGFFLALFWWCVTGLITGLENAQKEFVRIDRQVGSLFEQQTPKEEEPPEEKPGGAPAEAPEPVDEPVNNTLQTALERKLAVNAAYNCEC